jgi:hypothetical protein
MFRLSEIFNDLLIEAKTFNFVRAGDIRHAIDNHLIVEFNYWTKGRKDLAPGKRRVEIYAYGAMKEHNGRNFELQPCIRGFQLEGDTSGGKPGGWSKSKSRAWKMFYINRIDPNSFNVTDQVFTVPQNLFNTKGDKGMERVFAIIDFNKDVTKSFQDNSEVENSEVI